MNEDIVQKCVEAIEAEDLDGVSRSPRRTSRT